jgi:hypothetical protein
MRFYCHVCEIELDNRPRMREDLELECPACFGTCIEEVENTEMLVDEIIERESDRRPSQSMRYILQQRFVFTVDSLIPPPLLALLQMFGHHEQSDGGSPPASDEAISALPDVVVADNAELCTYECTICQETFQMNDRVKNLPCQHKFHATCIVPWLEMHNTCPTCRCEIK